MALFGRDRLPVRSTLSRFLAALTSEPVDTLRSLFLDDLRETARSRKKSKRVVWRIERETRGWSLIALARARQPESLRCPRQKRCPRLFGGWMTSVPPFYTGRKRGQVVRTRTVISQAHSFQWLGSFGNRGNGSYRTELRQALASITRYLTAHQLLQERALPRLDGH